jgi:hypothetical protein
MIGKQIFSLFIFILQLYLLPFFIIKAIFTNSGKFFEKLWEFIKQISPTRHSQHILGFFLIICAILPWYSFDITFEKDEKEYGNSIYNYYFIILAIINFILQFSNFRLVNVVKFLTICISGLLYFLCLLFPHEFLSQFQFSEDYSIIFPFYVFGGLLFILGIWNFFAGFSDD